LYGAPKTKLKYCTVTDHSYQNEFPSTASVIRVCFFQVLARKYFRPRKLNSNRVSNLSLKYQAFKYEASNISRTSTGSINSLDKASLRGILSRIKITLLRPVRKNLSMQCEL